MTLDSKQVQLTTNTAVFTALCCISLFLRFLARYLSPTGWWWDDGWSIVAFAVVMTSNAMSFISINNGLGVHIADQGSNLPNALYHLYFDQVFVHPGIAASKLLVILFYARIFSTPNYRRALWVLAILDILWLCGTLPAIIFNCVPIKKVWLGDTYEGGHCINLRAFFIGQAVPNTLLDVALLLLPISFVWRLQMSLTHKLAMSSVFAIGVFETVASICRLVYFIMLDPSDPTYNEWWSEVWSRLEVDVGFICACLMATGPLVRYLADTFGSSGQRSRDTPTPGFLNGTTKSTKVSRHRDEFERLTNMEGDTLYRPDNSYGAAAFGRRMDSPSRDIALDEIQVVKEVHVSEAKRV